LVKYLIPSLNGSPVSLQYLFTLCLLTNTKTLMSTPWKYMESIKIRLYSHWSLWFFTMVITKNDL